MHVHPTLNLVPETHAGYEANSTAKVIVFFFYFLEKCSLPSTPPNGHIIPYNSTIEGAEVTYVCWNIDRTLYQPMCKQTNRTAVCTADGSWEPNSDNICDEPSGITLLIVVQ